MKRPVLTVIVALLGAAAVAQADGVVYQTNDVGFASSPAPVFVQNSGFHSPRARSGISVGISTGNRVRTGVSIGIGSSTRVTRRRTITTTGGAVIRRSTVYPGGHYTQRRVSTVSHNGDAQRRVANSAEFNARRKLTSIRQQVESAGGALLSGGIRPAQVRWDGFNLEATSEVYATVLVPSAVAVNGTPIAQGTFQLVIPKSNARVPLACSEVVRLIRHPEGEQTTLFGAVLRRAWLDARGKMTKTRGAQLQIVSQTGVTQLEISSFDKALGRRVGRDRKLPALKTSQVEAHAQAMRSALQSLASGDARHYQALVAQRAGGFSGAQQGLSGQVNSR